jgi:GTP-binding protein
MLIDEVKIRVKAGKGGKGSVAFNKNMGALGPTGATGGHGGSVYAEGVSDLGALSHFRFKKEFVAEDGQNGKSQFNDGHRGEDLILHVPVGTVIHNLDKKKSEDITQIGQRVLIAQGGYGGRGNFHFRSAINTSPKEFEEGTPGESFNIRLELKLIADVGFVGLPNAGKSSLLNELTNAKTKVGNYAFTTLEPNLGVWYDLILADIPGLIEGASEGKGLGTKFLRHIERTSVLFHLVSANSETPINDYHIVRKELSQASQKLGQKKEYILISKGDLVSEEVLDNLVAQLSEINKDVLPISIHDLDSLKKIEKILAKIAKEKHAIQNTA